MKLISYHIAMVKIIKSIVKTFEEFKNLILDSSIEIVTFNLKTKIKVHQDLIRS